MQTGGGGRAPIDRRRYGDDGSGRGENAPNYRERLRRYRLGLAIALAAVAMLFLALSMVFLLRDGTGQDAAAYGRQWQPLPLPMALLALNTFVLALSSLAIELARRQAAEWVLLAPLRSISGISLRSRWKVSWLAVSIALGCAFLAGQGLAWKAVAANWNTGAQAGTAFFYLLTGAHALHLLAGLAAFLYAAAAKWLLARPAEICQIVVDTAAWYWHAIAALWLYLFVLLIWCPLT